MVKTRTQQSSGSEAPEQPEMRKLIASEVGEALQELLPGLFNQMKAELAEVVDEKVAAVMQATKGSSSAQRRDIHYKDFSACQPPTFEGKKDPLISTRWIADVEGAFRTSFCPAEAKVHFAANLLRHSAKDWWNLIVKTRTDSGVGIENMTWEEFKTLFMAKYVPPIEVDKIIKDFLSLEQTTESVNEITDKFFDKALFCPEYVATEKMKMFRYANMLKSSIREFVVTARCQTLDEMIEMARIRELELETQAQRRKQMQTPNTPNKKFKPHEDKEEKKKDFLTCNKCGKNHIGECRMGSGVCYRCGKPGHISRDCKVALAWCSNCNQMGHSKVNCPQMASGSVQAPAPATLRITGNGTGVKSETPKPRGRAFQLKAEEVEVTPDEN